jgi:RND family efflux transporter, MFP subunit
MKKGIAYSIIIVCVALAGWLLLRPGGADNQASTRQASVPEVTVVQLKPEEVVITQELNGRVTPYLIAEVRPQVNGIIVSRLFSEGSDVNERQPLYQIDPAMYEAEYNRAVANLEKARANVTLADAKFARYEQLIQARAVNQQEYDEVAAASTQARAEIGIAEAEVRLAKINLEYAQVESPISGRIGKSNVTQGALVTASQAEPLAVVQQLDPIYVDVAQPVSWMLNLQSDMQAGILQNTGKSYAEVRLMLDNGTTYNHIGKLLFADVTVDQTTGSISLRAEFPNPEHLLLPGMYVVAMLDVAQKQGAVTVPQTALHREADGSAYVFIVNQDSTVEKRYVTTIRTIDDKWLIGDGLSGNEQLVVEGTQRIRIIPGNPPPTVKAVVRD